MDFIGFRSVLKPIFLSASTQKGKKQKVPLCHHVTSVCSLMYHPQAIVGALTHIAHEQ
jgi:hypothetical protein